MSRNKLIFFGILVAIIDALCLEYIVARDTLPTFLTMLVIFTVAAINGSYATNLFKAIYNHLK